MKIIKIIIIIFGIAGLLCPGVKFTWAEEPTTVVFLTWKPNQAEVWDAVIRDFHQKNPGIRIKVQVGPHSSTEYHAIVAQRLKNRDASEKHRGQTYTIDRSDGI